MHPRLLSPAPLAALILAGAACKPTPSPSPSPSASPSPGAPSQARAPATRPARLPGQIDEGGYVLSINGTTVGGAFAYESSDYMVEIWVKYPTSWPTSLGSSTLTMAQTASTETCASWWASACESAQGAYLTTTVPLSSPNTTCPSNCPQEHTGTQTTFLWPGDYQIATGGSDMAWVYVDTTGEYWAMDQLVGTGKYGLSSAASDFATYAGFCGYECKQSPQPSSWFTPIYTSKSASCRLRQPPECGS